MKKYKHLTYALRTQLEAYLKINMDKKEIAKLLNVSLATIYNEIQRGTCELIDTHLKKYKKYCADVAEEKYQMNSVICAGICPTALFELFTRAAGAGVISSNLIALDDRCL